MVGKKVFGKALDCLSNDCTNLSAGVIIQGAYSFFDVCSKIAEVINGTHCITKMRSDLLPYKIIYVGNPYFSVKGFPELMSSVLKSGRKVLTYAIFEGTPFRVHIPEFITATQWLADISRKAGLKVIAVIPHGIDLLPINHLDYRESKNFLYIAGGEDTGRKYPPYLIEFFQQYGKTIDIMTDKKNRYRNYFNIIGEAYTLPRNELYRLYASYKFYFNLSDNEGFGLTPLEACSVGTVPVLGRFPPFTEIYSDKTAVWIDWSGEVEYVNFVFEYVHRHVLNPRDVLDAYKRALGMKREEWEERSAKCRELARRYDYRVLYREFLNYL